MKTANSASTSRIVSFGSRNGWKYENMPKITKVTKMPMTICSAVPSSTNMSRPVSTTLWKHWKISQAHMPGRYWKYRKRKCLIFSLLSRSAICSS